MKPRNRQTETPAGVQLHPRKLPPGWRWVKMGEVVAEALPGFACGERDPKGVVQLRMNNVDRRGRILLEEFLRVPADEQMVARYHLVPGDVMFNNTNSTELVGKTALFTGFSEPVVFSNHFTRLRAAKGLEPAFLAWWLLQQWQRKVFESICNRWVGQSAVKNDKLLGLVLPLPPLSEQRRIAGILNEQMREVEKARRATEAQLEAASVLPAAYLRGVFDSQEARRWPKKRLGDVCEIVGGNSLPAAGEATNGDRVYCLKVSDLDGPYYDGQRLNGGAFFTSRILAGNRILEPGAVVFPKRGGAIATNKKRILAVPSVLDPNLMGVQPVSQDVLLPSYLHRWFDSWSLASLQSGNVIPQINRQDLAPLVIPLPPISVQTYVTKSLRDLIDRAKQVCSDLSDRLAEVNKLPAALLRKAFAGGV